MGDGGSAIWPRLRTRTCPGPLLPRVAVLVFEPWPCEEEDRGIEEGDERRAPLPHTRLERLMGLLEPTVAVSLYA